MNNYTTGKDSANDKTIFESQELGIVDFAEAEFINPSGHRQEVYRNFSIWSALSVGVVTGNCWTALAGSLTVAISNGGPPGVLFEFIVACVMYAFISTSIAELSSAMPSSGGVYHFASICGGRFGRLTGWFAGWWNYCAYQFGTASMSAIVGKQLVTMYGLFHPDYEPQTWHAFIGYLVVTWATCCVVLFFNRALPLIQKASMFLVIAGVFVTITVCAIMPKANGKPYASNNFVWRDWVNETGWSSNGFVFVAGMLNGAYGIGTPDVISHLSEEIPRPSRNIPKAILLQNLIGFLTTLFYLIAMFYALDDLGAVIQTSSTFPLTEIYRQATGSAGGALGLVLVIFFSSFSNLIGGYIAVGRTLWTLSRDDAVPFSNFISKIHPTRRNPFNATMICGCTSTLLACVYVANTTAFNAFVGSFVTFSTLSYLAAILPHLLSRRSNVEPGDFWMRQRLAYVIHATSCLYIMAFIVIFCFPFTLPVDAASMNYTSLITGGISIFIAGWWLVKKGKYKGPKFVARNSVLLAKDAL
ncbi:MAG: hypothetical protein Q9166_001902 [cf. Caloplaca sp. 2 TL-2023]